MWEGAIAGLLSGAGENTKSERVAESFGPIVARDWSSELIARCGLRLFHPMQKLAGLAL